jgi:predicted RNase H-like HicB family nuclease
LLSDAKENGETLKLDEMEDLLDQADSFKEIMEKLQEAFEKSFGSGDLR